jgi:hypothetical protein
MEALLTGFLVDDPLKITSDIDSPLKYFADDSPNTHLTASITFDLPHPLGPTIPTRFEGRVRVVDSTKVLKPESLILLSRINNYKISCFILNELRYIYIIYSN